MRSPHLRIYAAGFLLSLTIALGSTPTPFYVFQQLGGTEAMAGYIGAAQSAGYALFCLASAPFVARTKNGLTWAFFGVGGYAVLYAAVPALRNPYLCGAVSAIAMGVLAFSWPALHSWVGAEPDPKTRSRHMSWFNISWSVGGAVGPLLAGPLYDTDYRLPFFLIPVCGMIVMALIWSLPHERHHFRPASEALLESRTEHDRASAVFLYAGWCATLTSNIVTGAMRTIYPKRIVDLMASGELRLFAEAAPVQSLLTAPATKFSWLVFTLGLITAIAFPILGRTSGWRHRFAFLVCFQAGAAVALWGLSATHSLAVMLLCFAVAGANHGVTFFSSAYYSLSDPDHKHRRAAINEAAVGSGGFCGNLSFGYLAGRYGLTMPFRWTPVLMAGALATETALLRYGRRKAATSLAAGTRL